MMMKDETNNCRVQIQLDTSRLCIPSINKPWYYQRKKIPSEISLIKTIPPAKLSFSSRSTIFLASRSLHSLEGELHSLEGSSRPDYDVHLHNKLMPAQQEGEGERTSHLDPPPLLPSPRRRSTQAK